MCWIMSYFYELITNYEAEARNEFILVLNLKCNYEGADIKIMNL